MKKILNRSPWSLTSLMVVVLAISIGLWISCGEKYNTVVEPDATQEVVLSSTNPQVRAVMEIQDRHTKEIMAKPGVVGTGTGMTEDGRPAIIVFVKNDVLAKTAAFPAKLEEVPVIVQVTGELRALKGPPPGKGGDDVYHTARFERPVPLGISTGHPSITAGTIGCRVKDGSGNVFALSNNHVYADENTANLGDAVIQPGTFDGGSSSADNIGYLAHFEPILFDGSPNTIDAAIASTTPADLSNTTTSDCYGTPKSTTIAPAVNMKVKKCGRTTGFTKGTILAINATVDVGYSTGVARFVDQIITTNISAGGDSGSLVVVDGKGKNKNDDRKPVGLLYAGSSSITILNPIDAVLTRFGVTIDGE